MAHSPFVREGFVFDLLDDLRPLHRLNPFTTTQPSPPFATYTNADALITKRAAGRPWMYTANGRQALREALRHLELSSEDCVTILTSTGNTYVSSCVTNEIARVCQWSRQWQPNTRAILVNHEFGVPYPEIDTLREHGLPIIEDCCYSFHSATAHNEMGRVGDYIIYSFAKYFPIQFGGLLVGPSGQEWPEELLDLDTVAYLRQALTHYLPQTDTIGEVRRANHATLASRLAPLGIAPRFSFDDGTVPAVFMFVAPAEWLLPELKEFLWACGIHCSVFYGEQAFFIPVHQSLTEEAMNYFTVCLTQFSQYKVVRT